MLNTAQSPQQFEAVVGIMAQEIAAAHHAARASLGHEGADVTPNLPPAGLAQPACQLEIDCLAIQRRKSCRRPRLAPDLKSKYGLE